MNNITLIGRLGNDPEQNEKRTVTTLSVATNDGFGDNEKTNWHTCKIFGKTQDIAIKYLSKGDMVALEGRVDYNKHEDKYFTNVLVSRLHLINPKKDDNPF